MTETTCDLTFSAKGAKHTSQRVCFPYHKKCYVTTWFQQKPRTEKHRVDLMRQTSINPSASQSINLYNISTEEDEDDSRNTTNDTLELKQD